MSLRTRQEQISDRLTDYRLHPQDGLRMLVGCESVCDPPKMQECTRVQVLATLRMLSWVVGVQNDQKIEKS